MPILNFQKQFAEAVRDGTKRQTIRSPRKYPIKKGDKLYLYTGLRTKNAEKIMEVECKSVKRVDLCGCGHRVVLQYNITEEEVVIKGRGLHAFAQKDGFSDWGEMWMWFTNTHGLPFRGTLIEW